MRWSDIVGNYIHVQRMEVAEYELGEDAEVRRNGVRVVEHTKSYAGDRRVYLNESARNLLALVKKRSMSYGFYDEDYIFVNSNSSRLTTGSINCYLYRLCDEVNTNRKSSHKIRKTYISALYDGGLNINKIREIAGHEDERTTLNNYCFDRSIDRDTEEKLESIANTIKHIV